MLEDIPQAGENDPKAIDPFKFALVMLGLFLFVVFLAAIGWPS